MIYVDDKQIPYGRMKMCHVLADTTTELEALALSIGLDPAYIENRGEPNEHLNVSQTYRAKAIAEGAQEVSSRALVKIIRRKRGMSPSERAGVVEDTPSEDAHYSDCATHNEPAYEAGDCDCDEAEAIPEAEPEEAPKPKRSTGKRGGVKIKRTTSRT